MHVSPDQDFPAEMRISDDGRRLILGGAPATGFYDESEVKVMELVFDQSNYQQNNVVYHHADFCLLLCYQMRRFYDVACVTFSS